MLNSAASRSSPMVRDLASMRLMGYGAGRGKESAGLCESTKLNCKMAKLQGRLAYSGGLKMTQFQ